MASRRLLNRLYYFTVEDEGILAEAFPKFEQEVFCIAYKVVGTDDVFVTTAETKEAMDRHDVPYNLLAEEEAGRIALHHTPQSKEELSEYEDAVRALALAHRAIGAVCVGVNGDTELGVALSQARPRTSPTSPRRPATPSSGACSASARRRWQFVRKRLPGDKKAIEWAEAMPLASAEELKSYH